jgi:hypothetical protein
MRTLRAAMLAAACLTAGPLPACPVCVVGPGLSPAQQLMNADAVLLVSPERGGWKTLEVIKGTQATIAAGALRAEEAGEPAPERVVLRDPMAKWVLLGALPQAHTPWLKQVAQGRAMSEISDADWRERVRFHVPYLEHQVPLIAETAYAEVARAPYAAMRSAKPQLDAASLVRWLDEPTLASRRLLYTLLLGITGGKAATQRVERLLAAAVREQDVSELSALLVADMELRGPARLAWIERTYLGDRGRWTPGLQAVLLALSEQGNADAAVPRARIVDAYRRFIRSGHPLAGYVAPDLQRWRDWSAVPDYVALIRAGVRQRPASAYAMRSYLGAAPQADAHVSASRIERLVAAD